MSILILFVRKLSKYLLQKKKPYNFGTAGVSCSLEVEGEGEVFCFLLKNDFQFKFKYLIMMRPP